VQEQKLERSSLSSDTCLNVYKLQSDKVLQVGISEMIEEIRSRYFERGIPVNPTDEH